MRRHALFIVGMPRSGASALASALVAAGASAGRTMRTTADGEPTWESAPLVVQSEDLARELGTRWDNLASLPDRWTERAVVRARVEAARAVVDADFAGVESAVVKDPRISRLLPFWREVFEAAGFDVAVAIMLRRPLEVAASMSRASPIALEKSLALWLAYLVAAERDSRGVQRVLVSFDRLLDAPAGTLANVVMATRFPVRIEGAAREAALTAIQPDLRRHGGLGSPPPAAALGSGLDRALDAGFERLSRLSPAADPKREIEALFQSSQAALTAAIPPWLAQELAVDREIAERHAEATVAARERIAALEQTIGQGKRAEAARDKTESELRARIEQLSRVGNREGLDNRIDEALSTLRDDVSRIAYTLADQPAREHALRTELSQAQRDLGDERMTIGRLSQELEDLRHTALAQQEQLENAREHLQALSSEVEQARAAHAARDAHEASLQQELGIAQDDARKLQSERDLSRRERDQAVRQLETLKADVEALRTETAIAVRERESLAREATRVGEALASLREEMARRAASETALADERSRLQAELRNASDRLSALERDLSKRTSELTAVSGRYDVAVRTLHAVERHWLGRFALNGTRRS